MHLFSKLLNEKLRFNQSKMVKTHRGVPRINKYYISIVRWFSPKTLRSKESKLMKRHAIESLAVTTSFNCSRCKGEKRIPAKQNEFRRFIFKYRLKSNFTVKAFQNYFFGECRIINEKAYDSWWFMTGALLESSLSGVRLFMDLTPEKYSNRIEFFAVYDHLIHTVSNYEIVNSPKKGINKAFVEFLPP